MIFVHACEVKNLNTGKKSSTDTWLNLNEIKAIQRMSSGIYAYFLISESDHCAYKIDKVCTDTDCLFDELFGQTDAEQQKGE